MSAAATDTRAETIGDVRVFAQYDRDIDEEVDVVVVGSGPAGAVVSKELAERGKSVVLVEEGPPFVPEEFEIDGGLSMSRTMREGGLRATRGTTMPTMQAIALGGGSLVNSAICNRAPNFVLDRWCADYELSRTALADLDPHYDAVGEFLEDIEACGQRDLVVDHDGALADIFSRVQNKSPLRLDRAAEMYGHIRRRTGRRDFQLGKQLIEIDFVE